MATYKGFNTQGEYHKFRTTDFNLIKHDLLNHFNIKYGEKLMKPTFGCGIWNYLFDPFTSDVTDKIVEEVKTIIDYDPRVNADNITVIGYEHGIQIELDISLVNTNQTSKMIFQFDRNLGAALAVSL